MQFYFFHLMPWPYLPDDFDQKYDSAWVWLPNSLYDPVKGHDLYNEYIDTLAYADELGFDGVCVNEHHQTAYGLMPSPNLIAAALTQRTRRCRIAVIGNALPLYNPPLRVAEEFAMLDVLSGGRLHAGMVIGGRPEYLAFPGHTLSAAALPQRPRRRRIAVIGNALPLYNPPLRVAEEFAMLDVLSGGRLDAGMVIGGGPEYFASSVNPTFARERFREALDLIVKA